MPFNLFYLCLCLGKFQNLNLGISIVSIPKGVEDFLLVVFFLVVFFVFFDKSSFLFTNKDVLVHNLPYFLIMPFRMMIWAQ